MSHIFVNKIATVGTNSVHIKDNSGFKIIWKSLPPKYNKESIFYYWLFKAVSDLTFDFEIGMGDISKAPTPVSTRINSVFSTLDHSVKLSVYRSVCIFHYFLTWLETLQWPLEGIILVFQMHKIIFIPVPPPLELFCVIFLPIFAYWYLFFCSSFSWEPFYCFTSFFLQTFLVLLRGLPHQEKLFSSSTRLWGAILRYFDAYFEGMLLYSWELFPHLISWNFVQIFSVTVILLRQFQSTNSSTVLLDLFWVYFSMSWKTWNIFLIFYLSVLILPSWSLK